ncbi:MAG: O-antigen ligase family protein [Phycisphaerales bacterium]|jgi:O-antigen ligase|nr:O-antigen ligase family protein [Phycisphaerales bacterium]
MSQAINIIFALLFIYWCFKLLFTPAMTWSLGIVGSTSISVTMGVYLGMGSGVSLAWLGLIVASAFLLKMRYGMRFFEGTWEEWAMLALAFAVFVSYYYTPAKEYGNYKMMLFLGSGVPIFFFSRMVGRTLSGLREAFASAITPAFVIVCLFSLSLVMGKGMDSGRFGGGMSIMYGLWIATCLGLFFHAFYKPGFFHQMLAIVGITAGMLTVPFTGSRSAFLAAFLSVLFAYASLKNALKTIAVGVIVLFVATVALQVVGGGYTASRLKNISTSALEESGRTRMYSCAFQGFLENPLLGTGAGGFSKILPRESWDVRLRVYPHNLWLEIACEQGLLGLVPLLFLTVMGFKHLFWIRKCVDRSFAIPIQVIFWVSFMQSMFTADLPMARGMFAILGLMAGLHQCFREEEAKLQFAEEPALDIDMLQSYPQHG